MDKDINLTKVFKDLVRELVKEELKNLNLSEKQTQLDFSKAVEEVAEVEEVELDFLIGDKKYPLTEAHKLFSGWLTTKGFTSVENKEKLREVLKKFIASEFHNEKALVLYLHPDTLEQLKPLIEKEF